MSAADARVHLLVSGRVQRVGFRRFVEARARELGLAGWVRNRANGDVEVLAEGDAAALDALRRHVGQGPPGAVVRQVHETAPPAGLPAADRPFTIHRG